MKNKLIAILPLLILTQSCFAMQNQSEADQMVSANSGVSTFNWLARPIYTNPNTNVVIPAISANAHLVCQADTIVHPTLTVLMWLILERSDKALNLVFSNPIKNINAQTHSGKTALFYATSNGYDFGVKKLLEHGADKELANSDGMTPLWIASSKGFEGCLRLLLSSGANKDTINNEGVCALTIAIFNGHDKCAKLLIDAGANVNAATPSGATPLGAAINYEKEKCIKLLLAAGASKEKALYHAAAIGYVNVCIRLILEGADVNAKLGPIEKTAKEIASANSHLNLARLFEKVARDGIEKVLSYDAANDECTICKKKYENNDFLMTLICGHAYHEKCLSESREKEPICKCDSLIWFSEPKIWRQEDTSSSEGKRERQEGDLRPVEKRARKK